MFLCFASVIFLFLTVLGENNSYVLQEAHVHKKEYGDLSVDLIINDEDYEMIDDHEMDRFESIQHEKVMKPHSSDTERVKDQKSKVYAEIDNRSTTKIAATWPSTDPQRKKETERIKPLPESQKFISENPNSIREKAYHPIKTGKLESRFRILDCIKEIVSLDMVTNCTIEDANGIGLRAIKCLFIDYQKNKQPLKILAIRFWRIAVVWLIVYLVVAIPLWCTKGWCCCCLCCKFFKPQETIQEAKRYLLLNPPGTLVTKRGGIIHYEPTEREIDCYEEFGHFIRTL